jgi:CHAT domain-containing protein/tetratricopeptide (TPR) repeat protein
MQQLDITIHGNSDSFDLLSVCALLRQFDRALLRVLVECGEDEIEALLGSDAVEAAADATGSYRLRDEARTQALARLREDHPSDELTWQTRIFEHFLRRMRESDEGQRATAEDECFHHLAELFQLIAVRREWHTMKAHLLAVDSALPQLQHHIHRLRFYEGYVAIRRQEYKASEEILTHLIAQDELMDDLRVEILNGLGQIQWFQTRYDQALYYYQQVQSLAQITGNTFYRAAALTNMAMIFQEIGQYERAVAIATQGLDLYKQIGDRYREAKTLYEVGNYALWLGRWQDANNYFAKALELYQILDIQAGLAQLHWAQGFLNHILGNDLDSEREYQRAIELSQSPTYGEPSVTMDSLILLGLLFQTQERWAEAQTSYEQSITWANRLGNQHRLNLIHYRCGNIFERQGLLDQAFEAYRTAVEGIEALRGDTKAEEIKIGLLGTVQQVYESMVLLCLARGQPEEAFAYVERARSRAFLDLLAGKHPELYDEAAQQVATLAEVQAALPADALLVEYYTTGVLPRGEALINKLPPENARLREHLALLPRVFGFAITRDSLELFEPKVDPNTLRPLPGDPGPGRRLLRDRLLTHLYDQLIAPVARLAEGRRLLYLVPHGPLHYVPFMALRSAAGAHLLREGGPAIALAPSATVLLRNCLRVRPAPPVTQSHPSQSREGEQITPPLPLWEREPGGEGRLPLLALGYNDEGEEALRYAEVEAGHVARLAGGAVLVGPATKRARLAEAGRQARRLHIAGHAVYDPHDPLGSYLQLGQGERLSAREIMGELELGADLVTLSACMSGVTHVVSDDELLGLQRAFLYAGAPAVVCTLWEAADMVALLVMDRFYTALGRGQAPGAALRDAQVSVRGMTGRDLQATLDRWRAGDPDFIAALGELPEVPHESLDAPIYADPFYWAPFMLIGRPD